MKVQLQRQNSEYITHKWISSLSLELFQSMYFLYNFTIKQRLIILVRKCYKLKFRYLSVAVLQRFNV